MFLAVVIDTNSPGQAAGVSFAASYANTKNFQFPTVPDVNSYIQRYFTLPAFPFNAFIDARTMTIKRVMHAGLTSSEITTQLEAILND